MKHEEWISSLNLNALSFPKLHLSSYASSLSQANYLSELALLVFFLFSPLRRVGASGGMQDASCIFHVCRESSSANHGTG